MLAASPPALCPGSVFRLQELELSESILEFLVEFVLSQDLTREPREWMDVLGEHVMWPSSERVTRRQDSWGKWGPYD